MLLVLVTVAPWLILLVLLLERPVVVAGIVGEVGSDDEAPNVSSLSKVSSELKDAISELEYSDSCSFMSCAMFLGNGPAASRVGPWTSILLVWLKGWEKKRSANESDEVLLALGINRSSHEAFFFSVFAQKSDPPSSKKPFLSTVHLYFHVTQGDTGLFFCSSSCTIVLIQLTILSTGSRSLMPSCWMRRWPFGY